MKGIIIYDTSHRNTRIIAEVIAETLKKEGMTADTFYVKDVKKMKAGDYDFLILGSPTRWGTMSFAVKGLLSKFKGEEWTNKPFAVFDTELVENIEKREGSAAEKIAEKLSEKHLRQLLPVLKAVVMSIKGPLREGEAEKAEDYAREIADALKQ